MQADDNDLRIGLATARRIAMTLIDPQLWNKSGSTADSQHAFICTVGICLELPRIRPSNVEIAEVLGCAVSRVQKAVPLWYALTWRERHGWCMLAEAWHGRTALQRG